MGNLLNKSEKRKKPEQSRIRESDRAVAELKVTRDKIKNYQKKLETNIKSLQLGIIECIKSKKKDQALIALRKQKYLEKTLVSTQGQLMNIDSLVLNMETAEMQQKVVNALQQGNALLRQINKELTVEDVDKLMAETEEAIEYQHQVGLALANQGVSNDEDLLDQLESLEVENIELPSVPDRPLVSEQKVSHKKAKVLLEST